MDAPRCNLSDLKNRTVSVPLPAPEPADYAEIGMLAILLAAGFPLNVLSCVRLLRRGQSPNCSNENISAPTVSNCVRRRNARWSKATTGAGSLLEFHLTVANLLVICLYGLSQICWLSTYSWLGGDLLCRLVKFSDTFCFYATANIVSVIAIDRVHVSLNIDRPNRHRNRCRQLSHTSALGTILIIAWILAFVCSIPQLFVWQIYTPYPCEFPNWRQCVTIWMAIPAAENQKGPSIHDHHMERLYMSFHLLFVFWAPLIIILCSYALIIFLFREKIALNIRDSRLQQRAMNAIVFKKRATSLHRKCRRQRNDVRNAIFESADEHQDWENKQCESSAGSLAAVPIVIQCSQAFVCEPMIANRTVNTLSKAQKRAIKTAFWIVLAYLTCWSPYNVLIFWRYLDDTFQSRLLEFSSNFIVLNAVLNPLIYKMN